MRIVFVLLFCIFSMFANESNNPPKKYAIFVGSFKLKDSVNTFVNTKLKPAKIKKPLLLIEYREYYALVYGWFFSENETIEFISKFQKDNPDEKPFAKALDKLYGMWNTHKNTQGELISGVPLAIFTIKGTSEVISNNIFERLVPIAKETEDAMIAAEEVSLQKDLEFNLQDEHHAFTNILDVQSQHTISDTKQISEHTIAITENKTTIQQSETVLPIKATEPICMQKSFISFEHIIEQSSHQINSGGNLDLGGFFGEKGAYQSLLFKYYVLNGYFTGSYKKFAKRSNKILDNNIHFANMAFEKSTQVDAKLDYQTLTFGYIYPFDFLSFGIEGFYRRYELSMQNITKNFNVRIDGYDFFPLLSLQSNFCGFGLEHLGIMRYSNLKDTKYWAFEYAASKKITSWLGINVGFKMESLDVKDSDFIEKKDSKNTNIGLRILF